MSRVDKKYPMPSPDGWGYGKNESLRPIGPGDPGGLPD